jgi:large subunit ribosomal protein L9
MTDVEGLGAEGEIVSVVEGYARNYLLPKKLAAPATEATRRRLAKMQAAREAEVAAQRESALAAAARLEGVSCTLPVKTGQDEKLYGSVTAGDIVDSLKLQGIELDRHTLVLEEPIKELGVFDIPVKLHPEVGASVKVWVVEE